MTGGAARPAVVSGAVWSLAIGGVMLAAGGLLMALIDVNTLRIPETISQETIQSFLIAYRGLGVIFTISAAGLIAFTLRASRRDSRSRRAVIALGLVVVLLEALAIALISNIPILVLLSMVLIIAGVLLLGRPVALAWFAGADDVEAGL